jgi:ubiquitin C-terminal hydrolase
MNSTLIVYFYVCVLYCVVLCCVVVLCAQPRVDASATAHRHRSSTGITLHDCLRVFTLSEQLGEQDAWYCSHCRAFQLATKKFDLWRLPPVLVLHLKRFKCNAWTREKLHTLVDFPVHAPLDLGQWIASPPPSDGTHPTYELFAVSVLPLHSASLHLFSFAMRLWVCV